MQHCRGGSTKSCADSGLPLEAFHACYVLPVLTAASATRRALSREPDFVRFARRRTADTARPVTGRHGCGPRSTGACGAVFLRTPALASMPYTCPWRTWARTSCWADPAVLLASCVGRGLRRPLGGAHGVLGRGARAGRPQQREVPLATRGVCPVLGGSRCAAGLQPPTHPPTHPPPTRPPTHPPTHPPGDPVHRLRCRRGGALGRRRCAGHPVSHRSGQS